MTTRLERKAGTQSEPGVPAEAQAFSAGDGRGHSGKRTGLGRQKVDSGKGYPKVRELLAPTAGKPFGAPRRQQTV